MHKLGMLEMVPLEVLVPMRMASDRNREGRGQRHMVCAAGDDETGADVYDM